MNNRRNKKNLFLKIINSSIFLSFFGLLLIVLISFPLAKNLSKKYAISEEIREIKKEIEELESKNKDIKKMIAYLESDQFVEEQGRRNLGLKKAGEEVVVIKEMDEIKNVNNVFSEAEDSDEDQSNQKKWIKYFLN